MADSALPLPRKDFVSTVTHSWKHRLFGLRRSFGEEFDFPNDPVLEASPLAGVDWATLFAYMHRRFGPPHLGADPYKDLSAGWLLSTPEPDIFLRIQPAFGAWFSLSPMIDSDEKGHELELDPADKERALNAYRDVLLDLMRPVAVRDSSINALGRIDESTEMAAALFGVGDEDEDAGFGVSYAPSSGYPMPLGFFGGEDWPTLVEIVSSYGDDDEGLVEARKRAIRAFQDLALPALRDAEWPIQRLVLIGAWALREDLADRAGLPEGVNQAIDAELEALNKNDGTGDLSVVAEMTDERIEAAKHILKRLGLLHASHLNHSIESYRDRYYGQAVLDDLRAIVGDGNVDELIPNRAWIESAAYLELLRGRGNPQIVAWAEAAQTNIHRRRAFINIGWNLHARAEQEAKDAAAPAGPA